MEGRPERQRNLFYVLDEESFVPGNHPLRKVKEMADAEMRRMGPAFKKAYSSTGRPSIPPEMLIKASLLQALYSIRSERQLCEQIGYNILFRWFLDLPLDAPVWNPTTFTKNRERFAEHGLMQRFFEGIVANGLSEGVASQEHFSVDGTLIEAWASMKSVRPKDEDDSDDDCGNGRDSNRWTDWHGEKRSNETHESKTDPEARLARKGKGRESILAHSLHALMENRHGLLMDVLVAAATGTAERECAEEMLRRYRRRHWTRPNTLAGDKGYDAGEFLRVLEEDLGITPHVAIREGRIKGKTAEAEARHLARKRQRNNGYRMSQRCRKRIEEIFGWMKTVAGLRKTRFIGRWKTQLYAYAAGAAYNLLRLTRLCVE